jgi:shikimate dehydrogenase
MTAMTSNSSATARVSSRPETAILTGLIGAGIGPSRSPNMHQAEADALGLRLIYKRIDLEALGVGVEALPELLRAAEITGFAGVNITHPCKQAVIPLLDTLSADAQALGAVNTVLFQNGKRIGHNTDWSGFAEAFRLRMPGAALDHVVQLGAGGAGAAVAYGVLKMGAQRLTIIDADSARSAALAAKFTEIFGPGRIAAASAPEGPLASATGLINATPIGMAAHPGLPLDAGLLRPKLWVAEIVYFPLQTELLTAARALGCATVDGGGMAVFQAAEAFRLFTGTTPDTVRMLARFSAS